MDYLPKWTEKAVIYHIYPIGFFDCPQINPIASPYYTPAQIQPILRLDKIRSFYRHLQKMGINTICFGPLFESCTHGYDTINYFQIDRRLGTNTLFKEIIAELHAQHFKIILDGVFNHVSRLFPAFLDLKSNQQKSRYINWFKNIDFNQDTIWHDGFDYQNWENHTELPELNLQNIDVQKYILNVIQYWTTEYDIDGWRLDVAYNLDINFIQKIKITCHQINPDCFLIGELIHEDYAKFIGNKALDSCTNYQLYQKIINSFNQNDPWQLSKELSRQQKLYPNFPLINFTGNHDTNRLFTALQIKSNFFDIFELIMSIPGIPCIYYGDEIGLDGEKLTQFDQDVRQSMPYPQNFTHRQKNNFIQISKIIRKHKK